MSNLIIIETTFDDKDEAKKCSEYLVSKKLAACVQLIGPIESTYIWDEQVAKEEEWCLRIKTKPEHYQNIEKTITHLHTYDIPEIISYPCEQVSPSYLKWVRKSCL